MACCWCNWIGSGCNWPTWEQTIKSWVQAAQNRVQPMLFLFMGNFQVPLCHLQKSQAKTATDMQLARPLTQRQGVEATCRLVVTVGTCMGSSLARLLLMATLGAYTISCRCPCDINSFKSGLREYDIVASKKNHHVSSDLTLCAVVSQRSLVLLGAVLQTPRCTTWQGRACHTGPQRSIN